MFSVESSERKLTGRRLAWLHALLVILAASSIYSRNYNARLLLFSKNELR